MWWYQMQFTFQSENMRQITKNSKLKHTRKLVEWADVTQM